MTSTLTGSATHRGGNGSLIVGGTGIASVAHFTLETITYLKAADRVFYLVYDPAIQAYIKENNTNTTDLAQYYDAGRNRFESHLEMTEAILLGVRAGHKVVALIYGHPGTTATPSHRALAMARQEGYEAKMLPAVSFEDCMFADLEIDPALHGYMASEATELLAHGRRLNPNVHNIIIGIGNIGEREDNSRLPLLIDFLEAEFGPDHRVLHYLAENLPQSSAAMVTYSINELRVDGMEAWILPTSALYIPPLRVQQPTENLGVPDIVLRYLGSSVQLADTAQGSRPTTLTDYGPYVEQAQTRLSRHEIPENYKSLRASSAMKKFMIDLSLQPALKTRYKSSLENRTTMLNETQGLTDRERLALRMGQAGPVAAVMLRASDLEPTEGELEMIQKEHGGEFEHPRIGT